MVSQMHAAQSAKPKQPVSAQAGVLQRKCDKCKKKWPLQRKAMQEGPSEVSPTVHEVLRSPGQPLDAKTQTFMEPGLGHDFNRIPLYPPVPGVIQTKLAINAPGDIYEQEADRIADRVLAAPAHHGVSGTPPRIQRLAGASIGQAEAVPASVDQVLASPGRPLEPALRQDMERRFGYDFSRVRVHTGAAAGQSARDVNAHAYTVGYNMVFGRGRFAPKTHEGRQLLTHELTHVVQQNGSISLFLQRKEGEGSYDWIIIKKITAKTKATGEKQGSGLTLNNETLSIKIEINNLSAGTYIMGPLTDKPERDSWSRISFKSKSANKFVYFLPPGYTVMDNTIIDIKPSPKEQRKAKAREIIKALDPHIRNFLIDPEAPEVSDEDLLRIARAGQILQEYGVTEEELLLQRQRRIDWQRIGKREGETTDPESWARSFVANLAKTRASVEASTSTLLETAKRISLAYPELINMIKHDKIIKIIETSDKQRIYMYDVRIKLLLKTYDPDREQDPFLNFDDLQLTLVKFEEALVSHLHHIAENVLDNTEAELIRTDKRFAGIWKPTQWGPGFLWEEIGKIKNIPEVIELEQEHMRFKQDIDRKNQEEEYALRFIPAPSQGHDEYEKRKKKRQKELEKEEHQYREALRNVVSEKSRVKISLGSGVEALLSAKSAEEAQERLIDSLIKGRSHVQDAKEKLDDRTFLYAADKIIDIEQDILEQALGSKSAKIVSDIIDQFARERRSETTLWDDIWKVLEIVAMFIPTPAGWLARMVMGARRAGKTIQSAADQADLFGGRLSAAPPPTESETALSAFGELAGEAIDIPAARASKLARVGRLGPELRTQEKVAKGMLEAEHAAAKASHAGGAAVKVSLPGEVLEALPLIKSTQVMLAGKSHALSIKRLGNEFKVILCSNGCGELIERCDQLLESVSDYVHRAEILSIKDSALRLQSGINSQKIAAEIVENDLKKLSRELEGVAAKEPVPFAQFTEEIIEERQGGIASKYKGERGALEKGNVPEENIRRTRTTRATEYDPTVGDPARLGDNLAKAGRPKPDFGDPAANYQAHHIIPSNEGPEVLRKLLKRHGLDINGEYNGIWLPTGSGAINLTAAIKHEFLTGSQEYFTRLRAILIKVPPLKEKQVIEKLREIASYLNRGELPPPKL
jgi:hypothetical protein